MKLHQALGLFIVILMLQACTCFGVPIDKYFPSLFAETTPPSQPHLQEGVNTSSPTLNCDALRLTSPLDGLPNGTATFYWDALPGATGYQINLFSDVGAFLAGFDATGDQTNLSADVSMGAIGGQYILGVEFIALGAQNQRCRQAYTLMREAPPSQPVQPESGPPEPEPIISPTPTCEELPGADYC